MTRGDWDSIRREAIEGLSDESTRPWMVLSAAAEGRDKPGMRTRDEAENAAFGGEPEDVDAD
jgi:hypothetical protein